MVKSGRIVVLGQGRKVERSWNSVKTTLDLDCSCGCLKLGQWVLGAMGEAELLVIVWLVAFRTHGSGCVLEEGVGRTYCLE